MEEQKQQQTIPLVDIGELLKPQEKQNEKVIGQTVEQIHLALKDIGFIYIQNHGVTEEFMGELIALAKEFFNQPQEEKMKIHMKQNGMAWRGYFELGYELTSGIPDQKEGYYFGLEHEENHECVKKGVPTFGKNVWPEKIPQFQVKYMEYWEKLQKIADALFEGISMGLGLERQYMKKRFTTDPVVLFRIFNYPEHKFKEEEDQYGVREHTDYGFLTILKQDQSGGLEVKTRDGDWVQAKPIENTFVINIGDMLELWTHGIYKANPHRVKNQAKHDRISMPYFYDPSWKTSLERIPIELLSQEELQSSQTKQQNKRWDGKDLSYLSKDVTYGDYLWTKISKVFPKLAKDRQEEEQQKDN